MRIVLVRPNYDSHIITPPLGLGYLASYLKKRGMEAKNSFKEPEWIPDGLTRSQLIEAQSRAFRTFYSHPLRFLRLAVSVKPKQLGYLWHRLQEYRVLMAPSPEKRVPGVPKPHVGRPAEPIHSRDRPD